MGIHDGHRERLRETFIENGLDAFNDLNALELLLFYAIPRKDTNELAHMLLDHFGSLNEVFGASVQELTAVRGIGENTAALITLVPQIMRKCKISQTKELSSIENPKDAGAYFVPRFAGFRDEVALMLCLNGRREVICCKEIGRGVVNGIDIDIRLVVETALKMKSQSVMIAHNHPGGSLNPSMEDEAFTRNVFRALRLVGIELEDHIIVSGDEYVSLADTVGMQIFR